MTSTLNKPFVSAGTALKLALVAAVASVMPGSPARASDESIYECTGHTYIASIQPFAPANGELHELERVVVSTKAEPQRVIWELWSHRDGETWSERGLKDGTSRKGVRLILRGFYAYLSHFDLDKPWPESETGLDVVGCAWK